MKIGLIDVDGHNYPNLALMKISAYHKKIGDSVEWYTPMFSGHMDRVYASKVFSFTRDIDYFIDADEVIKGGSGYCIEDVNGTEVYHKEKDIRLQPEIDNMFPDYSIYSHLEKWKDTAFGKLTKGCPRGCNFCHVKDMEGKKSYKTANLSSFWNGQKNIELLDPNFFACKDWRELAEQLIESKAYINFSQGIDIRIMNEEMCEYIKKMKIKMIHFAWDKYSDKEIVVPKLKMFKEMTGFKRWKVCVYILTNFDSTFEEDLERVYTVRDIGFSPDVRIYEKYNLPKGHRILQLQRYVNNRIIFNSCKSFDEYKKGGYRCRQHMDTLCRRHTIKHLLS